MRRKVICTKNLKKIKRKQWGKIVENSHTPIKPMKSKGKVQFPLEANRNV